MKPLTSAVRMSSSDDLPAEGDIALNSRVDTLYTRSFRQNTEGEGRFFNVVTLDDGSEKYELELTPRIKITFVFIKNKSDINAVHISKYRFHKRYGWREDKTEHVQLSPISMAKVIDLLKFLTTIDLGGIHERRIKLADDTLPEIDADTKNRIRTLLSQKDGPAIIDELLRSGVLDSKDIVNIGYRKAQLLVFDKLLHQDGFIDEYKQSQSITAAGAEPAWQRFFELNPWVLGYGLSYIWCTNIPDERLEQVVAGFDFNTHGKRVDALLHTSAHLSQFVLAEVKTPDAALVTTRPPRPGVWSPSSQLLDGVAQIQKTVSQFKQRYFEKAQLVTKDGEPLGLDVFNFSPKSYLLIGNLAEFTSEHGVNRDKYSSFELFRGSLRGPEIITFDELYARASAIVSQAEKQKV